MDVDVDWDPDLGYPSQVFNYNMLEGRFKQLQGKTPRERERETERQRDKKNK